MYHTRVGSAFVLSIGHWVKRFVSRSPIKLFVVLPFAFISEGGAAQMWVVGEPVDELLASWSGSYIACTEGLPWPDYAELSFSIPSSAVPGVDHVVRVLEVPQNSIAFGTAEPLSVPAPLQEFTVEDGSTFYADFIGQVTATLFIELRAIGTPLVAGVAHPCAGSGVFVEGALSGCRLPFSLDLELECVTVLQTSVNAPPHSSSWIRMNGAEIVINDPNLVEVRFFDQQGRSVLVVPGGRDAVGSNALAKGVYIVQAQRNDGSVILVRLAAGL